MENIKRNMELYLRLLGVKKKKVSLEALSELISAQLSTIPFENISKLYYNRLYKLDHLPSFSQYLNGISENSFGGTCYSNNYYFYKLLKYLGYNAKLCGADMNELDCHIVIIVSINYKDYLVDVGYAAPFLNPIPLYLETDRTIFAGRDEYIIKPRDNKGYSQLEMFRNDICKHGYVVKPVAKRIEDFNKVISDSYNNSSTFFNTLLITKYISGSFVTINNLELIELKQNVSSIRQISDTDELVELIERIFNIPQSITGEILKNIKFSEDAWN